ncbi:LON peptidase substrate-binding domain-containing protein [Opitutus terrae]|uniref:Peptidase S16 lon domain protein n=1 Tax=Opitutus terrae (strain DSM 11246 / JCM 15787 / PB90-1) TaxID=452637 RepID=B1ZMQ1_OPITP|nr:LON peptidase substrate-binding domain-containing protein [Opitutus terrae]ACB75329.1 peptidase S16 lon domain protein [Opitutus terrae PB90-1]
MELEIVVPDEVPVMTLPDVTLFPQALLPLHIFEPRYRQMLRDVLARDRLFAVAGLNQRLAEDPDQFEPPHLIASVGMIRACQENADGTSNLLLQGLCRVEFLQIVADEPYRRVRVRALPSAGLAMPSEESLRLRHELKRLLVLKQKLGAPMPAEFTAFLSNIEDPETFVDLAAFGLCDSPEVKQKLLETLDLPARLGLFKKHLRGEIEALKLRRKLQGGLPDSRIEEN